jgi:hypothetical protein
MREEAGLGYPLGRGQDFVDQPIIQVEILFQDDLDEAGALADGAWSTILTLPSAWAAWAVCMVISKAWLSQKRQPWRRLFWSWSWARVTLAWRCALWRCRVEVLRPYSLLRAARVVDPAMRAWSIFWRWGWLQMVQDMVDLRFSVKSVKSYRFL